MNAVRTTAAALVVFGATMGVAAQDRGPADGPGVREAHPEREARRGQMREQMKARLLERFDDNGDGELDEAERAAVRETLGPMLRQHGKRGGPHRKHMHRLALERFDADESGDLNDAERAEARAYFERKKAEMIERFDADGDGQLTGAERDAAREHHRTKRMLDANRDGEVDAVDAQVITQRAAAGERIPDINGDGAQDASDVAELLRRIGSFED